MQIRFDDNDDLVVDDIPEDLMAQLEALAAERGRTVEDEMRDLLIKFVAKWKAGAA